MMCLLGKEWNEPVLRYEGCNIVLLARVGNPQSRPQQTRRRLIKWESCLLRINVPHIMTTSTIRILGLGMLFRKDIVPK